MSQDDANAKNGSDGEVERKKTESIHLDARSLTPGKVNATLSKTLRHFHLAKEAIEAVANSPATTEYVLAIDETIQKGLDSGELELMRRKTGEVLCAVTRKSENSNRRVISQRLDAYERTIPSVDPAQRMQTVSADLANIAVQQQLAEISAELKDVVDGMKRIEEGQWADRYALIDAAESELRDVLAMENEENRIAAIRSARGYLKEGTAKISNAMKQRMDSVERVPDQWHQIGFRMFTTFGNYYDKTCEWYNFADECFNMLDKAYTLLCLCAIAMGEPNVLETTLDEYAKRLSEMGTDKLLSVGNINPDVDLSGEWFADVKAYIEGKRKETKLLAEGERIEVVVTGEMILEAIEDETGEGSDDGEREDEPLRDGE